MRNQIAVNEKRTEILLGQILMTARHTRRERVSGAMDGGLQASRAVWIHDRLPWLSPFGQMQIGYPRMFPKEGYAGMNKLMGNVTK